MKPDNLCGSSRYPSAYVDLYGYNRGPRCSPVVEDDRVYIYGAEGKLHCLKVTDGSLIWECDTAGQFGVVQNFFGVGSTPVIYRDLLIAMVGGSPPEDQRVPPGQLDRVSGNGSAIVAFDKWTGRVRYQVGDELASYASPRLAPAGGSPVVFYAVSRGGLVGFHPSSGAVDFRFPWRAKLLESVNASTPVVVGQSGLHQRSLWSGKCACWSSTRSVPPVWSDQDQRRRQVHSGALEYADLSRGVSVRLQRSTLSRGSSCAAWNGRPAR